jgi:hypothetical protein
MEAEAASPGHFQARSLRQPAANRHIHFPPEIPAGVCRPISRGVRWDRLLSLPAKRLRRPL